MKILFISQYFHPENFSNNKLVQRLVERGHTVDVMCAIPNYPKGKFFPGYGIFKNRKSDFHGANVERVVVIPRGTNPLQLLLNYFSFVISGSWRSLRLKANSYDVIFCSAPSPLTIAIPGIVASRRTGAPCIMWVQDLWPQTPIEMLKLKNRFLVGGLGRLCRWIYGCQKRILVPSKAFVECIREFSPDGKFHYFPNTIETFHKPVEADPEFRANLGIGRNDLVLMYAGNMGRAQGIDVIIDAAAKIDDPSIHFVFLGEGRDKPRIEARVDELKLTKNFHFLGSVSPTDVSNHLACADAALLTLKSDPVFAPTVPYRLQSFLGCGKLILASIDGESARIVETSGAGFVSKPEDASHLAENILTLKSMSARDRRAMEIKSRQYAESRYDETVVYDQLEAELHQIAATTSQPI